MKTLKFIYFSKLLIQCLIFATLIVFNCVSCVKTQPKYFFTDVQDEELRGIWIFHLSDYSVSNVNKNNDSGYNHGGFLVRMIVDGKSKIQMFDNFENLRVQILESTIFKSLNCILFSKSIAGYNNTEKLERDKLLYYCKLNNISVYVEIYEKNLTKKRYKKLNWN